MNPPTNNLLRPVLFVLFLSGLATPRAFAQATAADRMVQFRSIDLATNIVEVFNFGDTDVALDGWRLCSHDNVDAFDYSAANSLNGFTIEAGTSFFIHWDNGNLVEDADNVNVSTLGGAWANLNFDAFGLAFYTGAPFGGSSGPGNMIDSLQWSIGGSEDLLADARTGVAQTAGLWVNEANNDDEWISIANPNADVITLNDDTGGLLHGPSDYTVTSPLAADRDGDSDVDVADALAWQRDDGSAPGLADWQSEFGEGAVSPVIAAVPEPSASALTLMGLLAIGRRRN